MDTDSILTIGAVAVGGYFLYQLLKPTTTQAQTEVNLSNLFKKDNVYQGSSETDSQNNPYVYLNTKSKNLIGQTTSTTYQFGSGDYDKLNFAQKLLLATKIVPTSWVLG